MLFLFFTVRGVKLGQLWNTKLQEQQFQTRKLSLRRISTPMRFYFYFYFFSLFHHFIECGLNKHKCILVVKQRQFGLNFHFFSLQINVSKLCLYMLVSMTLQLCDDFLSFIISDYCMPYNVTILFKKNGWKHQYKAYHK